MKASIHHFSIPRNKHSIHTPESDLPLPPKHCPPPPFPLIQNILKISFYSRSRSSKVHLRTTRNWRCDAMREIRMDG